MSGTPPRNGSPGPRSAGVGGGIPHSPLSAFLQSELTTLAGEARKVRGAGAHGDQIKEVRCRHEIALLEGKTWLNYLVAFFRRFIAPFWNH